MSDMVSQLDQGVKFLDPEKEKEANKVSTEKFGTKDSVQKKLFKMAHYSKNGGKVEIDNSKSPDYQRIQKYPSYKANFGPAARDYINKGIASEIKANINLDDNEKEELVQMLDFVGFVDLDFYNKYFIKSANTQIAIPGDPPKGMYGNIHKDSAPAEIKEVFDKYHSIVNVNYQDFSTFANSACAKSINPNYSVLLRTKALLFKADASSWDISDARWALQAISVINSLKEKCSQHTCKPIKLIDNTICGSEVETALMGFGVKV